MSTDETRTMTGAAEAMEALSAAFREASTSLDAFSAAWKESQAKLPTLADAQREFAAWRQRQKDGQ